MSQKKVDAYKQQKANREKIMKREKNILRVEKLIGAAVGVVAVCWVGFSVYDKVTYTEPEAVVAKETVMDTTALDEYISGLSVETDDIVDDDLDGEDIEEIVGEDAEELEALIGEDAEEAEEIVDENIADEEEDADASEADEEDADEEITDTEDTEE